MVVMTPREKWTDERLDDLNKKVDDGFAKTKAEMREGFTRVEGEIKRLDGNIERIEETLGELRREINARFESAGLRFDSLNRSLQAVMVAVIVALLGSNTF